MKVTIEKFLELASLNPVLDVRTPAEFELGHIPGAFNFPLFSNDERKTIGTIYKKQGHLKAVLVGLDLVKDRLTAMVKDAVKFSARDTLLIHCWRGGMRSESVAWLLNSARLPVCTLEGGYKSFRNYVLDYFEQKINLAIISGTTGSGKTEILHKLKAKGEQVIDLEQLAEHKGSVFGGIGQKAQPTSEHFQNLLFGEIRKFDLSRLIWVEDENPVIGKVALPAGLWRQMVQAPRVRILLNRESRIRRLVEEYAQQDFDKLSSGIRQLEKRLGNRAMRDAVKSLQNGNPDVTAGILLTYYDKAYLNSFEKKKKTEWFRIESDQLDTETIADEIISKVKQVEATVNHG